MSDLLAAFPARLMILAAWSLGFLVILGLGIGLRRLAGLRRGPEHRGEDFWLGWPLLLFLLQAGHVLRPVDDLMRMGLLALGAVGLFLERGALLGWIRRSRPLPMLALALAAAGFAHILCGPPELPDTAGYHMMAIRWAREHPLVIGLANLYGRLGFNSAHFLYGAFLEVGPLEGRAHHVANGLLLLVLLAQLAGRARRFLFSRGVRLSDCVAVFLLPGALGVLGRDVTHSCGTDLPLLVAGSVITLWLATLFEGSAARRDRRLAAFGVLALGAGMVTLKLSGVVFAVTAGLLVLTRRSSLAVTRRQQVAALGVVLLLALVWMGRGLAQSGHLAFPVTATAVDVPWRVPEKLASEFEGSVGSWVRRPLDAREARDASAELPPWLARLLQRRFEFLYPVILGAVGLVAALFGRRASRRRLVLLAPPVAAIIFWWWTAPDPRLAGAALWAFLAIGVSLGATTLTRCGRPVRIALLLIALLPTALPLRYVAWNPPSGALGFGDYPQPEMVPFETTSGLILSVPKDGPDCWNAELPCTPRPDRRLTLRRENDLRSGFRMASRPK